MENPVRWMMLAVALMSLAPALADAAPVYRIRGRVQTPNGVPASDIAVIACIQPFDNCDETKLRAKAVPSGADTATFGLDLPGPGPFRIVFWKDVNRNDSADAGDIIGVLHRGESIVITPDQPVETGTTKLVVHNGGAERGGEGQVAPGALAGSWSQRSSSSELTLTPKVRVMPGISATGMSLGGMGSGASSVTTTIQNEYSSVQTDRAMQLNIRPDGGFTWVIEKSRAASPSDPNCKIVTREEKTGVAQTSGNQVRFQITGGTQSARNTCDPGKSSASAKSPGSETYAYAVAGSTLRISGSGGVNWVFNRR